MIKKKQNLFKTICLSIVIAIVFSFANVNAETPFNCDKRYGDNPLQINKDFGLSMVKNGNQYTIKVNPKSSDAARLKLFKSVEFKIIKVNPSKNNGDLIGKTVKAGQNLVVTIDGTTSVDIGGWGAEVTLSANLNEGGRKICTSTNASVEIKLAATDYDDKPIVELENISIGDDELQAVEQGTKIDCSNFRTKFDHSSFEYKFCYAKYYATHKSDGTAIPKFTRAKDKESKYTMVNFTGAFNGTSIDDNVKYSDVVDTLKTEGGKKIGQYRAFKCKSIVSQSYEEAIKSEDNYYKDNKHYMYGSGERPYSAGRYKYHFQNEQVTYGKEAKCKVTCEESVVVKYGPPVATRAGACFEYKIKVESRVSCYMSQKPEKPEVYNEVCTPTPRCIGEDYVINQGGPNDEFDRCINSCDGGKYTDKCNDKCYDKVYGNKNNEKTINYEVKKQANQPFSKDKYASISISGNNSKHPGWGNGYYYRESNSDINWYEYGSKQKGRWYYFHDWGIEGHVYTRVENGIPRTAACQDNCFWVKETCTGEHQYLNYGLAEYDKQENIKIYNDAVNKCKAKAVCTTSTAEYTISASYEKPTDDPKVTVQTWIDFPKTTTKKDKLSTCALTSGKQNTAEANKEVSTILDYAGCYFNTNPSCETQNYYMTEWSFPDTWVRKKTGEVSYTKPTDTTGWRQKTDRFCLAPDAGRVNQNFARWYYKTIEKLPEDYYCPVEYQAGTSNPKVSKYNIKGDTTRFGYYEWNISIKCFYAIDDTHPETSKKTGAKSCKVTDDGEYKIRTVTNIELFPSTSGKATANGTTEGREAGYNWTSDSALTEKTIIPNYVNDPVQVKEYIQKVGNQIYNGDTYVDYEFVLSPNDLKLIKQYNARLSSFDIFCGKLDDTLTPLGKDNETGITFYKSNLFRSGIDGNTWNECKTAPNSIIKGNSVKALGNTGCNNDGAGNSCNTSY